LTLCVRFGMNYQSYIIPTKNSIIKSLRKQWRTSCRHVQSLPLTLELLQVGPVTEISAVCIAVLLFGQTNWSTPPDHRKWLSSIFVFLKPRGFLYLTAIIEVHS